MKKIIVALLAVSTLGAIAIPSHAGDTGNSQTSTNVSTIDGNRNNVDQTNRQSIDSGRGRGRGRGDEANVQDALNDSDVLGNNNHVDQRNNQRIRTNRR
jgi:hypothetical protein